MNVTSLNAWFQYILNLFNLIWQSSFVPENWLQVVVFPIQKPGSLGIAAKDICPIALTSCVCKLFERMFNVLMMLFLEHYRHHLPSQFGFYKCHD